MQALHCLAPVSIPDRYPEHYTYKFRSSDDGHSIIITEYINEHNHDISQALYNLIPAQHRLEQPDKYKAGPWLPCWYEGGAPGTSQLGIVVAKLKRMDILILQ